MATSTNGARGACWICINLRLSWYWSIGWKCDQFAIMKNKKFTFYIWNEINKYIDEVLFKYVCINVNTEVYY